METQRAQLLAQLLREMRAGDRDFFPDDVWQELHKTVAMPYIELLIPRKKGDQWEFFLTCRAALDPDWPSTWHVPGGFWRTRLTQREACQSIALRELGTQLEDDVHELMTYKWVTHPRGKVISHVCLCRPKGVLETNKDARFFCDIPSPFIEQEVQFIEKAISYLKDNPRSPFASGEQTE